MANYLPPNPWQLIKPTPEKVYLNRREVVKKLGIVVGLSAISPIVLGCQSKEDKEKQAAYGNHFYFNGMEDLYPASHNQKYTLDRPLTTEYDATHQNNFYEFISRQDPNIYNVYKFVDDFDNRDWQIEVSGLVNKPGTYDLEDWMKRFDLEERTYRFRCVERWSMAVPWTGFPLQALIKYLEPTNNAKYIRMISYANAKEMEGVRNLTHYPWPYFEGLRIDEAMNELSLMATGIYGKPLPKQNGAPLRLIVPWKYGYKNIKSIVKLEFIDHEPETFWHTVAPDEYPFISNVDPEVPHPRWSQAFETMLSEEEERPTLKFNGYGEYVASLYK